MGGRGLDAGRPCPPPLGMPEGFLEEEPEEVLRSGFFGGGGRVSKWALFMAIMGIEAAV